MQYCPGLTAVEFYSPGVLSNYSSRFIRPRSVARFGLGVACSLMMAALVALVASPPARADERDVSPGWSQTGTASFYAKFWHGRRTASGDRFDNNELTAAHPWLPFGTRVKVLVEDTGREVVVTITDRMFSRSRVIDLSQRAARLLGIMRQGTAEVLLVAE